MSRFIFGAAIAALVLSVPTAAQADENLFAYSYGSETLPAGGTEAYLWATDRRGKGSGDYNAQDYRLELEHGFTNRLQASLYMNFLSVRGEGLDPVIEDVDRNFVWNGMQAAAKYALLSPYKDPIGLAVYLEPGFARYSGKDGEREDQRTLEAKILLQKNFAGDRITWVGNLTGEQEWARAVGDDKWAKEFAFEASTGLGMRIAQGLHLGAEGRYSSVYVHGNRDKWAIFAGPTIHYAARKWWGTLSYQHQVNGNPGTLSSSRNLDSFTDREIRLKIGYNF